MASPMGNETRFSILPTKDPGDPGFLGPDYDPSDFIPVPGDVGVQRGSSLGKVVDAIKAAQYYVDTIGFGEPSNPTFKAKLPVLQYGISYFMRTGMKCDNGAEAYQYIDLVPKGDALGEAVQRGLASSGLPQLKGLAPGAVEDAKAALNPLPLVRSLTGTGYIKCQQQSAVVGDLYGRTGDQNGSWIQGHYDQIWIDSIKRPLNIQTRWVAKTDKNGMPISITKEEYDRTPKIYNPDGSPRKQSRESFVDGGSSSLQILFAGVLAVGGMAVLKIMSSK